MNKAFKFLLKNYLKEFLIVSIGLTFAASLIDFVQHFSRIDGVNREFLYFYYTFCQYFLFIYPLAFVFAAIITFVKLVWENKLVALLSFGYSKSFIIKPFLILFFIVYILVTILNFGSFAYSADKAEAILAKRELFNSLDNIFFKYNNSFVFAKSLDPVHKEFKDVTLYIIQNSKLKELLYFQKANFKDGKWIAKNVEKRVINYKGSKPIGYKVFKLDKEIILKDYYPKVIRLLYEGKRMSIKDGIRALILLNKQNVDSSKVKVALFTKLLMPLFAPMLIVIFFAYTPISKRFLNRVKYISISVGVTLVTWTLFYTINMLSVNSVIDVDFGEPLAILILFLITIYIWKRKHNNF